MFNARGHSKPSGRLLILKNARHGDGGLKESDRYGLLQESGGPFESPIALARCAVGGDVLLHGERTVTIEGHLE